VTSEELIISLREARDRAERVAGDLEDGEITEAEKHSAVIEDAQNVLYAAEIGLWILDPRYRPKDKAVARLEDLLDA
jgi:hypothetical protein